MKNKLFKKIFTSLIFITSILNTNYAKTDPYKKAEFNRIKPEDLNISVFTFNDRNRNGIYDLGDSVMAGVKTELTKYDGIILSQESNKNGYANYKMSLGSSNYRHINKGGELYIFKVLEPPNWEITTNNKKQNIIFQNKVGSPSGIIANEAPHWVGLAPILTIRGQITSQDNSSLPNDLMINILNPKGKRKKLKVNQNGDFLIAAEKGLWQLEFYSNSINWKLTRKIIVKHSPISIINIIAGENQSSQNKQKIVENFDWIKFSRLEKIRNNHLGLNWNYLLAMNHQNSRGQGYINVLNSGHGIGYNSSGHPVEIKSSNKKSFDFIGGYFTVAWSKANGETLIIEAFRNQKKIYASEIELSHLGSKWVDAELRNIDKLIIKTKHYWQFATDDLMFRVEK